jgi:hypothetical protein
MKCPNCGLSNEFPNGYVDPFGNVLNDQCKCKDSLDYGEFDNLILFACQEYMNRMSQYHQEHGSVSGAKLKQIKQFIREHRDDLLFYSRCACCGGTGRYENQVCEICLGDGTRKE